MSNQAIQFEIEVESDLPFQAKSSVIWLTDYTNGPHDLFGVLLQVNNENYINMKFNHDFSKSDVFILEVIDCFESFILYVI